MNDGWLIPYDHVKGKLLYSSSVILEILAWPSSAPASDWSDPLGRRLLPECFQTFCPGWLGGQVCGDPAPVPSCLWWVDSAQVWGLLSGPRWLSTVSSFSAAPSALTVMYCALFSNHSELESGRGMFFIGGLHYDPNRKSSWAQIIPQTYKDWTWQYL